MASEPFANGAVLLLWRRLNDKREQAGISWRTVAVQAGVNPSTISRMSSGHAPGFENAERLFAWLRDERRAECLHDWRLGHVVHGLGLPAEHYYCTRCLERQRLEAL